MLRWGILGPGVVAGEFLAPAMREAGHDLAIVGSRSLTRAQGFASNHGVRKARGSYDEVIEARDVDAVYIALPNDLHEEWAIAALEAGKHVLCEKPLSTDAASAGRIAATAARVGGVVMEAIMTRFHPRTTALLDVVRTGELGELRTVTATFTATLRDPGNYRTRPEHGGGALLDLGVYGVSAARWIVGDEPDGVRAAMRRWSTGVDGTTAALLAFPDGAMATVSCSLEAAGHESLEVVGTRGVARVPIAFSAGEDLDAPLLVDGVVRGSWRANPYVEMVRDFADSIESSTTPSLRIDDSVATAEVLDRIRGESL